MPDKFGVETSEKNAYPNYGGLKISRFFQFNLLEGMEGGI